MAQFKKKNEQKFWHSPLALGVIFCILLLFAYKMIGLIERSIETSKKKNLETEEINSLKVRQADLSASIGKLSTDEGIEASIRDKYQVAKPGEGVINIVDQNTSSSNPAPASEPHGFWANIAAFFHL